WTVFVLYRRLAAAAAAGRTSGFPSDREERITADDIDVLTHADAHMIEYFIKEGLQLILRFPVLHDDRVHIQLFFELVDFPSFRTEVRMVFTESLYFLEILFHFCKTIYEAGGRRISIQQFPVFAVVPVFLSLHNLAVQGIELIHDFQFLFSYHLHHLFPNSIILQDLPSTPVFPKCLNSIYKSYGYGLKLK